jgi:hypothetical protein
VVEPLFELRTRLRLRLPISLSLFTLLNSLEFPQLVGSGKERYLRVCDLLGGLCSVA